MAYPVLAGAALEVVLEGRHENQQVMNVLHYRYTGSTTLGNGAAVAVGVLDLMNNAGGLAQLWRDCLSVKVEDLTIRVQWIQPARFAYIRTGIMGNDGAVAGNAMPVNTAISITRRGESANRHNIGTTHVPGVPVDAILNGQLVGIFAAPYQAFASKMLEPLTVLDPAATFVPVILNRQDFAESVSPVNWTLHTFARVMRRRTVGVGA